MFLENLPNTLRGDKRLQHATVLHDCVFVSIQLFQKRLSQSTVDTGTERNYGYSVVSDNAPVKFATEWPQHCDEPALYIMQSQLNANSNKLFVLSEFINYMFKDNKKQQTFKITMFARA